MPVNPRKRHLAAAFVLVAGCSERAMPAESFGLDCIFDLRQPSTTCARVHEARAQAPVLSDARDLVLTSIEVTRGAATLTINAHLQGRFWSETDQNLYIFAGAPIPETYTLSADPTFASDFGYPVRSALALPHGAELRVGIMAPDERPYTPQVYVNDPVHAEAVGAGASVTVKVEGSDVHVEVPLERYYAVKKAPIPDKLGVTVATARDYVGFIDHLAVRDLPSGGTERQTERASPPVLYPTLDARSHQLDRVVLRRAGSAVAVELDTDAPIVDWGQTNLHFFFIPVPPYTASKPLPDPSRMKSLPYKWSYYCAVYSPRRIFCKTSHGKDFTFDTAYAERSTLEAPEGVTFRELSRGRYELGLDGKMDTLRGGRATFALVVAAGRDGFGPTTWYGLGAR